MTPKKGLFVLSCIFGFLALQASAQQSSETPNKAIETIIGKWQLEKVYAGSREITSNPNSENQSWIEFNEDGTYAQQAENSDKGSYRLNENHSILYLESNDQKESSSAATSAPRLKEYNISIRNGVLTMQPREESGSATKYVYAKGTATEEGNK